MATRTRAKKATSGDEPATATKEVASFIEAAMQSIDVLRSRAQQAEVAFTVAEQKRQESEVATVESIKELKAEHQRVCEQMSKLGDAFRELKKEHHELQIKYVAKESVVSSLQRTVDQLMRRLAERCVVNAADTYSEAGSSQADHTDVSAQEGATDLPARVAKYSAEYRGLSRSQRMMEELSEVSSCTPSTVATGYCHSSASSALAALRASGSR